MKLTIDLDKTTTHHIGDNHSLYRKSSDLVDNRGNYVGKIDVNIRLNGKSLAQIECKDIRMNGSLAMDETVCCKIIK